MKEVAIIGAGWYGLHIARVLAAMGHKVIILEASSHILGGVSGMFGIRNHAGPHYPRSPKTRESCRRGAREFEELYPELVIQHTHSIYALGKKDASDLPPKVSPDEFRAVCKESDGYRKIDPSQFGLNKTEIHNAFDVHEPSIVVGERLKRFWEQCLKESGIEVWCHFPVVNVKRNKDKLIVNDVLEVDAVVNATGFQKLLPEKPLPFSMDVKYQVCLALVYEDFKTTEAPFSIIFMDGEFPCLMPYVNEIEDPQNENRKYIMTHGKWTIMCSTDTPDEAKIILNQIQDDLVRKKIKPRCEAEMLRFWPNFAGRFKYVGWKATVLPKIRADGEFRSAVTFADADQNMIHVIPGKITNVGDAARETSSLITGKNLKQEGHYRFVDGGVLDEGLGEIKEKVGVRNTCDLQTYQELKSLPEIKESRMEQRIVPPAPLGSFESSKLQAPRVSRTSSAPPIS